MYNRKFYDHFSLHGLPLFLYYNWKQFNIKFTWLLFTLWYFYFQWFPCILCWVGSRCSEWPYIHHILVFLLCTVSYGMTVIISSGWFILGWKLMALIAMPSLPALTCKLPAAPTFVPITSILGHTAWRRVKHLPCPHALKTVSNTQRRQTSRNLSSMYTITQWNCKSELEFWFLRRCTEL